jgi:PhnB protein
MRRHCLGAHLLNSRGENRYADINDIDLAYRDISFPSQGAFLYWLARVASALSERAALSVSGGRTEIISLGQHRRIGGIDVNEHAKFIPQGFCPITAFLVVNDGPAAIEFYKRGFAALEIGRLTMPDARIAHAILTVGGRRLMLCDEFNHLPCRSPLTTGGSTVVLHIYVEDVDATVARLVAAGATVTMQPADTMWGDRVANIRDPFGHCWSVATHLRDVPQSEVETAFNAALTRKES